MRRAAVVARQVAPQAVAGDNASKAEDLFRLADTNGDGKIDRDEFETLAAAAGMKPHTPLDPGSEEFLLALRKALPPICKFKYSKVKEAAKAAFRNRVPVRQIEEVLNESKNKGTLPMHINMIVKELQQDEKDAWARAIQDRAHWEEEQRLFKDDKREKKKERLAREASEQQTRQLRMAAGAGLAVSAIAAIVSGARKLHKHIKKKLPRSFATSNFKRVYDTTQVPRFADEMHSATRNFLRAFARQHSVCEHAVDDFYERLFSSAVSAGGTEEMLDRAQRSSYAVRVWTSAETMIVHGVQREFCSMLQQSIREDGCCEREENHASEALKHAAVLCRAINEVLCRGRGNQSSVTWPSGPNCADSEARSTEANVTWRGGGLPARHKEFYTPGKKFRTDMFVATSFHLEVAQDFWRRAQEDPVEFKVTFGAGKVCRHVNFISGVSLVDDEKEFLFPPYSVFEVIEVHWSEDLAAEPHRIVLRAAMDNMHDPEDLPVSPWI